MRTRHGLETTVSASRASQELSGNLVNYFALILTFLRFHCVGRLAMFSPLKLFKLTVTVTYLNCRNVSSLITRLELKEAEEIGDCMLFCAVPFILSHTVK